LWLALSFYFRNFRVVEKDKLWQVIKKGFFNNIIILEAAKAPNTAMLPDRRRILLESLNSGWRGNRLI